MYNILIKYGTAIAFGIGLLIAVLFMITAVSGVNSMGGNPTHEDLYPKGFFDIGLKGAYFLLIVAVAALVLFGLWTVVTNPKGAIKGIAGVGILAVIFIISYSMASTDNVDEALKIKENITDGISKFISGGITTTSILLIGAVVVAILGEIRGIFK
ncbi:MAG: hypothetical protein AAF502_04675 [Bacteroidota bacterium]